MAKMTLKVKVNDPHFNYRYQLRISQDAGVVQIWWLQLKSVTCWEAKIHGRMDRPRQQQYHFDLKGQGKNEILF